MGQRGHGTSHSTVRHGYVGDELLTIEDLCSELRQRFDLRPPPARNTVTGRLSRAGVLTDGGRPRTGRDEFAPCFVWVRRERKLLTWESAVDRVGARLASFEAEVRRDGQLPFVEVGRAA